MSSENETIYFKDFSIELINKPGVLGMGKGYYFTFFRDPLSKRLNKKESIGPITFQDSDENKFSDFLSKKSGYGKEAQIMNQIRPIYKKYKMDTELLSPEDFPLDISAEFQYYEYQREKDKARENKETEAQYDSMGFNDSLGGKRRTKKSNKKSSKKSNKKSNKKSSKSNKRKSNKRK
jgi:hypothetical protein